MSNPSGGGRDDCWSDGGTVCLVDAWGTRYLRLNRGNLRQQDWSDVASDVNARQDLLGRPRRTDGQCKNRIDTVKKRYKLEKSKPYGTSNWPLFKKFDSIVSGAGGPTPLVNSAKMLTLPRNSNPNPNFEGVSSGSSSRSRFESDDDDDNTDDDVDFRENGLRGKRKWEGLVGCGRGGGGGGEMGELARAIVGFAEVYERVERAKQQHAMAMERQRMEFAKEVEFRRMKLYVEAQVDIEKMKLKTKGTKYRSESGEKILNLLI